MPCGGCCTRSVFRGAQNRLRLSDEPIPDSNCAVQECHVYHTGKATHCALSLNGAWSKAHEEHRKSVREGLISKSLILKANNSSAKRKGIGQNGLKLLECLERLTAQERGAKVAKQYRLDLLKAYSMFKVLQEANVFKGYIKELGCFFLTDCVLGIVQILEKAGIVARRMSGTQGDIFLHNFLSLTVALNPLRVAVVYALEALHPVMKPQNYALLLRVGHFFTRCSFWLQLGLPAMNPTRAVLLRCLKSFVPALSPYTCVHGGCKHACLPPSSVLFSESHALKALKAKPKGLASLRLSFSAPVNSFPPAAASAAARGPPALSSSAGPPQAAGLSPHSASAAGQASSSGAAPIAPIALPDQVAQDCVEKVMGELDLADPNDEQARPAIWSRYYRKLLGLVAQSSPTVLATPFAGSPFCFQHHKLVMRDPMLWYKTPEKKISQQAHGKIPSFREFSANHNESNAFSCLEKLKVFRKLNEAKHRKEMAGKIIMHHLQAGAKTAVFSSRQESEGKLLQDLLTSLTRGNYSPFLFGGLEAELQRRVSKLFAVFMASPAVLVLLASTVIPASYQQSKNITIRLERTAEEQAEAAAAAAVASGQVTVHVAGTPLNAKQIASNKLDADIQIRQQVMAASSTSAASSSSSLALVSMFRSPSKPSSSSHPATPPATPAIPPSGASAPVSTASSSSSLHGSAPGATGQGRSRRSVRFNTKLFFAPAAQYTDDQVKAEEKEAEPSPQAQPQAQAQEQTAASASASAVPSKSAKNAAKKAASPILLPPKGEKGPGGNDQATDHRRKMVLCKVCGCLDEDKGKKFCGDCGAPYDL